MNMQEGRGGERKARTTGQPIPECLHMRKGSNRTCEQENGVGSARRRQLYDGGTDVAGDKWGGEG